jgi:serine/threonine protein kinase
MKKSPFSLTRALHQIFPMASNVPQSNQSPMSVDAPAGAAAPLAATAPLDAAAMLGGLVGAVPGASQAVPASTLASVALGATSAAGAGVAANNGSGAAAANNNNNNTASMMMGGAGGGEGGGGGGGGGAAGTVASAEMDAQQRKELRNLIVAIKSKNSNQQLHGLTQLKILSSADAKNKVVIREEGTIGPTVLLLASENVKIQLAAVRLLRSLSVNEENQQAIADENGIPPLINLLESPFAKLQLNAAATLWNLSVNDDNKRKIAKEGAIRPLIFLLDSNNIKVQNEACGALRNLSFNDKNQRLIGKDGGITLLLDLLKSDDENLKRNSAITLNNLTSSNEENKRRLRKEGGVELLISVLLANDINVLGFDPEKELQKRPRPDGFKGTATVTGNGSEDSSVSLTTEVFDTVVWNDIKIEKKIGSGAYGDVYKARYHGYPIAVKIIKESLSAEEAKREKILEEIKIMSMLKHPNVVGLVGCCLSPDHQVAIVTEFAARGNLKDSLKDIKSLPQRLKLAKDIVAGLNWMHANNIIHRDLKLANLLVTEDLQIKITDFGLSLHWYEGIVCHHFKGNVKYSSPEILRARADKNITIYQYCPQTDVYSFGLMLWELVTVMPLFPGVKGKQNITQHVLAGNRPEIYEEWPKSLKTLLALCWHEDPNRRPLFREIQDKFDRVIIDVMCPDPSGRRICKKLWKGCELKKVTYEEFEEAFLEKTRLNLKLIRHIHLKCFDAAGSQLLTNEGFMLLDQVLDRVDWQPGAAADGAVRVTDWRGLQFAGFDERSGALVYKQPNALVVNAPGADVVHFAAAKLGVDVVATRQHELYVRNASASDVAAAAGAGAAKVRRVQAPFEKMTCDALLAAKAVTAVDFLAAAPGGVAPPSQPLLRVAPALLELYGCWLAAGAAVDERARVVLPRGSAFVETRLRACGVECADASVLSDSVNALFDASLRAWALTRLDKAAARSVIAGLQHGSSDADAIVAPSVCLRDDVVRLCLHAGFAASFEARGGGGDGGWRVCYSDAPHDAEPRLQLRGAGAAVTERATGDRTWCVDMSSDARANDGFVVVRRVVRDEARGGVVVGASRATIQGNCLCAVICDNFDDTITLERFCNAVNWFGPMYPVEKFLERIRDLLQKKWFHGFVNSNKAAQLLKTRWSSTKQQYYLYRFSLSTPGCFALTFIEEDGTIVHKRISHSFNSSFVLMNNSPPLDFPTIDLLHAGCVQDANLLRSKKILPGSPFSSLFE